MNQKLRIITYVLGLGLLVVYLITYQNDFWFIVEIFLSVVFVIVILVSIIQFSKNREHSQKRVVLLIILILYLLISAITYFFFVL